MRGSIQQRGSSWRLQIEGERIGNKRSRRYVTIKGGTKRDAQRELTRLLKAADDGTLPDPSRVTVAQYTSETLTALAHKLSGKTLERYTEITARQLTPYIGEHRLSKLRAEHVEHWHGELLATGLSALTVLHAHRLLSRVLNRAVKNRVLTSNVASIAGAPAVEAREIAILEPDQVAAVLAALKGHTLYPIAFLALATGARRGELCGLQWTDIDLDRGVLRIERSVEQTGTGLRVKPTKTRRGKRNIALSAEAVTMLREHRKQQIELRLALGQGGQPTLVFSTIEGDYLKPNGISRSWRQTCKAKKLPRVAFHSLRHCHASALIRAGIDILTISRRLGHSKAAMTLDVYGHLIEGSDSAAAKAIEGMLK